MQMRKTKADQAVEVTCVILSNISKGTAFLCQGVTNCGFQYLFLFLFFILTTHQSLHLNTLHANFITPARQEFGVTDQFSCKL